MYKKLFLILCSALTLGILSSCDVKFEMEAVPGMNTADPGIDIFLDYGGTKGALNPMKYTIDDNIATAALYYDDSWDLHGYGDWDSETKKIHIATTPQEECIIYLLGGASVESDTWEWPDNGYELGKAGSGCVAAWIPNRIMYANVPGADRWKPGDAKVITLDYDSFIESQIANTLKVKNVSSIINDDRKGEIVGVCAKHIPTAAKPFRSWFVPHDCVTINNAGNVSLFAERLLNSEKNKDGEYVFYVPSGEFQSDTDEETVLAKVVYKEGGFDVARYYEISQCSDGLYEVDFSHEVSTAYDDITTEETDTRKIRFYHDASCTSEIDEDDVAYQGRDYTFYVKGTCNGSADSFNMQFPYNGNFYEGMRIFVYDGSTLIANISAYGSGSVELDYGKAYKFVLSYPGANSTKSDSAVYPLTFTSEATYSSEGTIGVSGRPRIVTGIEPYLVWGGTTDDYIGSYSKVQLFTYVPEGGFDEQQSNGIDTKARVTYYGGYREIHEFGDAIEVYNDSTFVTCHISNSLSDVNNLSPSYSTRTYATISGSGIYLDYRSTYFTASLSTTASARVALPNGRVHSGMAKDSNIAENTVNKTIYSRTPDIRILPESYNANSTTAYITDFGVAANNKTIKDNWANAGIYIHPGNYMTEEESYVQLFYDIENKTEGRRSFPVQLTCGTKTTVFNVSPVGLFYPRASSSLTFPITVSRTCTSGTSRRMINYAVEDKLLNIWGFRYTSPSNQWCANSNGEFIIMYGDSYASINGGSYKILGGLGRNYAYGYTFQNDPPIPCAFVARTGNDKDTCFKDSYKEFIKNGPCSSYFTSLSLAVRAYLMNDTDDQITYTYAGLLNKCRPIQSQVNAGYVQLSVSIDTTSPNLYYAWE